MSTDEREWATLEAVLGIAGVQVTGWQYQETHTIRVRVKSKNEMGVCPDCNKVCTHEHDVGHEQLVRDLPMSGKRCWLIYRPRRYGCKRCERTFVERVGWKSPDLNYTLRYEAYIYERGRRESMADVAREERLSEAVVGSIFERWAKKLLPSVDIPS